LALTTGNENQYSLATPSRHRHTSQYIKVGSRKQITDRIGVSLLDEEEIENQLVARAEPQSRGGRRFLIQQLIARGYKRHEIAGKLHVSVKTIYNILNSFEN